MLGVVLWSDPQERKAVIWCDDHGDLAFYSHPETDDSQEALAAGDLVEFDMNTEPGYRLAHNLKMVSEAVYPNIADSLASVLPGKVKPALRQGEGHVIPFVRKEDRRDRELRLPN